MPHKDVLSRPPVSLAQQVYERLRDAIITGSLAPGARLVELDLARQMGTSQGPVRDALYRLERDGLVQRQARSATFVSAIIPAEMYELFQVRSLIEGFAVRRAIAHLTPERLAELQALVAAMRAAGAADDLALLVRYDLEFHRRICVWSGSTGLVLAWDPLYSQIQRFVVQTHKPYFRDVLEIAETHQPIVDVLAAGDADAAEQVIREHIMLIWGRMAAPG